jgi:hypothetical protein
LVTVPEVLSMMLLSPPLAHVWTPRLKRYALLFCVPIVSNISYHIGLSLMKSTPSDKKILALFMSISYF